MSTEPKITTRKVLCDVLIAYPPANWWQALLKAWLLRSCQKHKEH